jgi:pimeloyl-ACP methyl ester carboxylesterase
VSSSRPIRAIRPPRQGRQAHIGHWTSPEGHEEYLEAYRATLAELPEPDRTLDVSTDFGIVRMYRFAGRSRARPLVLLPGTRSGSPMFGGNVPSLLEQDDCYLVDLLGEPGLGLQTRPIGSDDDKAEWLDQALAELPEERFHLVGVSLGGWTAVNLAVRRPEHVASVTTLDAVNLFAPMPLGFLVRAIVTSLPGTPDSWRRRFNSSLAGGADTGDLPVARMIEAGLKHFRMDQPPPRRFTQEQLQSLKVPLHAVIAGRSRVHDPERSVRVARAILPRGRVSFFPEASHAINGEYPQEIAQIVGEFLDEVERRG